jgi:hypothetical protein
MQSPRRRVGPTFLSDRIPAITQLQSALIQEAMLGIGMLDEQGWLLGDPERNRIVRRVRTEFSWGGGRGLWAICMHHRLAGRLADCAAQHLPPSCALLQNTTSPAYDWDVKLKAALPWLADDSPTLSLVYRRCGIQQALNVAYARHDAVAGAQPPTARAQPFQLRPRWHAGGCRRRPARAGRAVSGGRQPCWVARLSRQPLLPLAALLSTHASLSCAPPQTT